MVKVINEAETGKTAPNPGVTDIQERRRARAKRAKASAAGVELGDSAREQRIAEKAVDESDEVRADVVARMKIRVRNNAVRVDPRKIARKLTDDAGG